MAQGASLALQIAHRLDRSLGLYKQNPPARVLRQSAQADFGFVAAISNRQVLLLCPWWCEPYIYPLYELLQGKKHIGNRLMLKHIRKKTNSLKKQWKVSRFFPAQRQPF